MARMPLGEMLEHRFRAGHTPLYFLVMNKWVDFAPWVAGVLRVPSVFSSLAALPFVFLLAKRFSRVGILTAAVLFLLHPAGLWAAQTAHPSALLAFCMAGSSWLLLVQMRAPSRAKGGALFVATFAGVMTHSFYLLFLAAQLAFLAWEYRREIMQRRSAWGPLAGGGALALPVLLSVLFMQDQVGAVGGEAPPGVPVFDIAGAFLAGGYGGLGFGNELRIPVLAAGVGALALLTWSIVRERQFSPRDRPGADARLTRYLLCWVVGYSVLAALVLLVATQEFGPVRYYLVTVPGAVLLLARAGEAIPWLAGRIGYGAVLIGLMLPATVEWLSWPGDGVDETAIYLKENHAARQPIILCDGELLREGLTFYSAKPLLMFMVPLDRELKRPDIAAKVLPAIRPAGRAWLVLYHEQESPVERLLVQEGPAVVESETEFQDVRVLELNLPPFR